MRLQPGFCCAIVLSCLPLSAQNWPCDICICPQYRIWYDYETEDSMWLCDEHACGGSGCDCGSVTREVFRYYTGFQDVGDCLLECDIYCEQIFTVGLGPDPNPESFSATPTAVPAEAAKAPAVESDRSKQPSKRPGAVKRKSMRMEKTGDPSKTDLENLEIKIGGADGWNPHIKSAETVAGSTCYVKVDRVQGNLATIKLFTIRFVIEIVREGQPTVIKTVDRKMGYEVPPAMAEPACTNAVTKVAQIEASQETELNNTNKPVHVVDGFYTISLGTENSYSVRTKHDIKEFAP